MSAQPQSYSIIFDAYVDYADAQVDVGYGITKNTSGSGYVVASTANLATSHNGTFHGVAITLGPVGQTFQYQCDGIVGAGFLPFVGAGAIEAAVLASDGKIRRASAASGIPIGQCDLEGNVAIAAVGSVLGTLAGDVTGNPLANTVEAIRNAAIPALAGNGGKGLVLNALATAFTFAVLATSGYDTADHTGGGQEVLSATGSAGVFGIRGGAALAFDGWAQGPAASIGAVRLPALPRNGGASTDDFFDVFRRNGANTGNIRVLGAFTDFGSTNVLFFGDTDNDGLGLTTGASGQVFVSAGTTGVSAFTTAGLAMGAAITAGLPISFGTSPAQSGAGIRLPKFGSATPLFTLRNNAGSGDISAVTCLGGDVLMFGDTLADVYLEGYGSYATFATWAGAGVFAIAKDNGTPASIQLGDGGAGTINIYTGAGAPSASYPNGSVYFRNNAADAATFLYGRIGGAWVSIGGGVGSGVTWADDLSTSSDTHQYVSQITGSAGVCNVVSGTVMKFLGATAVAASGVLRFIKNQTIIAARNNGDSADIQVLWTTSGDQIKVGANGALGVAPGVIEVGTGVATSGAVRLANNTKVNWRNAANSGDVLGVGVDNANNIVLGGAGTAGAFVDGVTGTNLLVNGSYVLACSSSMITALLPVDLGSNYIKVGANPATTGAARFANNTVAAAARNAANSLNGVLLQTTSGNALIVGDAVVWGTTTVKAVSTVELAPNGTAVVSTTDLLTSLSANVQLVSSSSPGSMPSGGPKMWGKSGMFSFWGSNTPASGKEVRMAFVACRTTTSNTEEFDLEVEIHDPSGNYQTGRYIKIYKHQDV